MSFILRSHRDRYRQRAREGLYRTFAVIACFAATLIIGYVGGQKKQEQEVRQLKHQTEQSIEQKESAEASSSKLQSAHQTLNIQFQQLTDQYNRDVPHGDLGLLASLVKEQLDKGLAVERMAQIIRSAQPPQNCTTAINKRFIITTPNYTGPESVITFAEGVITVKGSGDSSINSKKEKEAWFDPGKPVTIVFTIIGGKSEQKTGLLPLHHTIIHKNKEYRFTVSEGPRSFVAIASDSCDYPENVLAPTQAAGQSTSETESSTSTD